jgi:hypothetical protein
VTEAEFRALCLGLPEVTEGFTFFEANGEDLARPRPF